MKKIFLLLAAACVTLSAAADEGMWMLPYLQKMNSKDMKARGCKLSAEEIYSMNNSSLKDAIVIFGGGCTGEIVSPDGLLFTNHHCGYGSIQSLSSVEHDYLKNGFWAMSRAEELPAPGLKVRFIRRIVDVTPDVLGAVPDIAGGGEREELVAGQVKAVSERLAGENPGMDVEIKSFFGGNQYFAFVIEVFRDVRLVGAPPTSIGKFGGDTDNWMWPRHTGDFSVFRVYAGPDNRPADYSPENRPYKAEKFLKISLGGYDEGDFAMIMGFPGSTQRYMTSYEIDRLLEVENPQRIFIRGERQAILKEDMAASAKVRIQYASKYAQSSNYWKNSIGKSRGIRRLDVKGRKQEQEAAFTAWAAKNTLPTEGYSNALNLIRESVEETAPYFASSQYLSEAIGRSVEILVPARLAVSKKGGELTEALKAFYKDYNMPTDRRVAKRMFRIVGENCKELPSVFAEVIGKRFGGDTDAYVDYLYDNSVFADERKALAAAAAGTDVSNDPAVLLNKSYTAKMRELAAAQLAGKRKFAFGIGITAEIARRIKFLEFFGHGELRGVLRVFLLHHALERRIVVVFDAVGRRIGQHAAIGEPQREVGIRSPRLFRVLEHQPRHVFTASLVIFFHDRLACLGKRVILLPYRFYKRGNGVGSILIGRKSTDQLIDLFLRCK